MPTLLSGSYPQLTGKIEHRIALEDAVSVIDIEGPTPRPTPRNACSQKNSHRYHRKSTAARIRQQKTPNLSEAETVLRSQPWA